MISIRGERGEETIPLEELEARIRRGDVKPSTELRIAVLTGDRWVPARELELFARLYEPARLHMRRSFTLSGVPALTLLLVVVNLVVFFALAGRDRSIPLDALIHAGAKESAHILELGETWRLITANFLHRDLLHLVFNTFFLLNLGGTLESAYRRADLALILVAAGLGTTLTSALLSDVPSVGSSGLVLGLFGAAAVFGAKNADVLPTRYRRYFTGALLPYAIFVLYVGLASPHTDNWGHVGGLVAGVLVALPLRPRIVHVAQPLAGLRASVSWLLALALLACTLLAGPILRVLPSRLVPMEEQQSGLAVAYPARWLLGENHLGFPAVGNALGATLGVRARTDARSPLSLDELERRFWREDLQPRLDQGTLTQAGDRRVEDRSVGGLPARLIHLELESRAGRISTLNVLVARGYLSYAVVLAIPEPYAEDYAPLVDAILAGVRFFEPPSVTRARRVVEAMPSLPTAELELGERLAELGDVKGARGAYLRALEKLPESSGAETALLKLALDYDLDLGEARTRARRLLEARPDEVDVVVLSAELEARSGSIAAARAQLRAASERLGDVRELREAMRRLLGSE